MQTALGSRKLRYFEAALPQITCYSMMKYRPTEKKKKKAMKLNESRFIHDAPDFLYNTYYEGLMRYYHGYNSCGQPMIAHCQLLCQEIYFCFLLFSNHLDGSNTWTKWGALLAVYILYMHYSCLQIYTSVYV